jgi:hypothetical protein
VKPGDPLFEIHDLSQPLVRGYVADRERAAVRVGQRARVRVAAVPRWVAEGRVIQTGQVIGTGEDTGDRSLSVWVQLTDTPPAPLLDGMLARLTLVVGEGTLAFTVPQGAVLHDGTRDYIFVRRTDGAFERRLVATGRGDDRLVAITKGLQEGELVAVRGVAELQTAYASLK